MKKRIAVVIPWDSMFMLTNAALNMMNWEKPHDCEVRFFKGNGWCPAARHNSGLNKAQEWGADFILFNGADHLCPKDIISKMLRRIDEGWDMVHAAAPSRGTCGRESDPFVGVTYKIVGPIPNGDDAILHLPKESLENVRADLDDPQQAHICGTGTLLMKADLLSGLKKPYFREVLMRDEYFSRFCVQDSAFVLQCTTKLNAKLFADTSIKIIHMDLFGIDETYKERFKDKANQDWSPSLDMKDYI